MDESIHLRDFIAVKGLKAIGNRLTTYPVLNIELFEADEQMEQGSENLLQELLKAQKTPSAPAEVDLFSVDEPNPEAAVDSELEDLEQQMARFKAQRGGSSNEE